MSLSWTVAGIGAVLLVVAGIAKLWSPNETATAIASVGLFRSRLAVRALGAAEIAVGGAVLLSPSRPAHALLAGFYALFAAFVGLAKKREVPLRSCGCFGKLDTPPSTIHVVADLIVAAAAASAVVFGSDLNPPMGAIAWVGVAVGAYLAYGILTALPTAMSEVRA